MVPDDSTTDDQRDPEWGTTRHSEEPDDAWGQDSRRSDRQQQGYQNTVQPRESSSWKSGFGTPLNALFGGIAGIVFSFVPFSGVLGGALAGYLEAGSPESRNLFRAGLKVGGLAGAVMFVPFLFLAYLMFGFFTAVGGPEFGGVLFVMMVFAALYTIGAGMLGGVLGVILHSEVEGDSQSRPNW